MLKFNDTTPLYLQIAEWLETEILIGRVKEEEQIYSQYKLAEMFNVNPATAAKGLNVLADEGILYDRRGIGKFVATQAKERIKAQRKNKTMRHLIQELIQEATHLEMEEDELLMRVQTLYQEMKEGL